MQLKAQHWEQQLGLEMASPLDLPLVNLLAKPLVLQSVQRKEMRLVPQWALR